MFSIEPYTLPDDGLVMPDTRRPLWPRYEKEPVLSYGLPEIQPSYSTEYPFDERWCSTQARLYRAPHLHPDIWAREERARRGLYPIPETMIQLYSIITSVNIKTIYVLERTAHPVKTWKRMLISYHLSEHAPSVHVVDEIDL